MAQYLSSGSRPGTRCGAWSLKRMSFSVEVKTDWAPTAIHAATHTHGLFNASPSRPFTMVFEKAQSQITRERLGQRADVGTISDQLGSGQLASETILWQLPGISTGEPSWQRSHFGRVLRLQDLPFKLYGEAESSLIHPASRTIKPTLPCNCKHL